MEWFSCQNLNRNPERVSQNIWNSAYFPLNQYSIGWFKGKITGNSHISWENPWFPVDFPLSQPVEFHVWLVKSPYKIGGLGIRIHHFFPQAGKSDHARAQRRVWRPTSQRARSMAGEGEFMGKREWGIHFHGIHGEFILDFNGNLWGVHMEFIGNSWDDSAWCLLFGDFLGIWPEPAVRQFSHGSLGPKFGAKWKSVPSGN